MTPALAEYNNNWIGGRYECVICTDMQRWLVEQERTIVTKFPINLGHYMLPFTVYMLH